MTRHLIGLATIAALVFGTAATATAQQAPNANCTAGGPGWARCVISNSQRGGE